jgi:hypothetical protein
MAQGFMGGFSPRRAGAANAGVVPCSGIDNLARMRGVEPLPGVAVDPRQGGCEAIDPNPFRDFRSLVNPYPPSGGADPTARLAGANGDLRKSYGDFTESMEGLLGAGVGDPSGIADSRGSASAGAAFSSGTSLAPSSARTPDFSYCGASPG